MSGAYEPRPFYISDCHANIINFCKGADKANFITRNNNGVAVFTACGHESYLIDSIINRYIDYETAIVLLIINIIFISIKHFPGNPIHIITVILRISHCGKIIKSPKSIG